MSQALRKVLLSADFQEEARDLVTDCDAIFKPDQEPVLTHMGLVTASLPA